MNQQKHYQEEIRENYRLLTTYLIRHGYSITTMESATGGQIASLITDTEGASAILKGAFITYSNEAKIRMGVPAKVIEQYSVYSRETAAEMAMACRRAYGADIGIGVTGSMGNIDPANEAFSVPGQLFFSICFGERLTDPCAGEEAETVRTFFVRLDPQPTRLAWKLAAADRVYEALMQMLSEKEARTDE